MKKFLLFVTMVLLNISVVQAAIAPINFQLVPEKSSIKFKATQGSNLVNGEFRKFAADISFHPEALEASRVKVVIDMSSFSSSDKDANSALGDAEFFNIKKFPEAVFESTSFKSLGGNNYEADGKLNIKGIVQPVVLAFTLDSFSPESAHITGKATLKRTLFGIGEKRTDSIKDDVEVVVSVEGKG